MFKPTSVNKQSFVKKLGERKRLLGPYHMSITKRSRMFCWEYLAIGKSNRCEFKISKNLEVTWTELSVYLM